MIDGLFLSQGYTKVDKISYVKNRTLFRDKGSIWELSSPHYDTLVIPSGYLINILPYMDKQGDLLYYTTNLSEELKRVPCICEGIVKCVLSMDFNVMFIEYATSLISVYKGLEGFNILDSDGIYYEEITLEHATKLIFNGNLN